MTLVSKQEWDKFLEIHPDAHLLQTSTWGDFKSGHGWFAKYMIVGGVGAQILFRKLPLKRTIAYIPKGPVNSLTKKFLAEVVQVCKRENAFLLYIEPDEWEGSSSIKKLIKEGFSPSAISIQPDRTIVISLFEDLQTMLSRMKQKTRYNIRLAGKKDVQVEISQDISTFTELIKITGSRDQFGIHTAEYYRNVYQKFAPGGNCVLLIASYQGNPLAGIMVFARGKRAWYFYGASNDQERNRMPTYLLQWEAMQWAKSRGCTEYDLWGIPDANEEELEDQFKNRSDGLWGVYRFKRGFGGEIKKAAGVFQVILNPFWYRIYMFLMKVRKSQII